MLHSTSSTNVSSMWGSNGAVRRIASVNNMGTLHRMEAGLASPRPHADAGAVSDAPPALPLEALIEPVEAESDASDAKGLDKKVLGGPASSDLGEHGSREAAFVMAHPKRSVVAALCVYMAASFALIHTMNYVHYHLPEQPPLPDLGHEYIPMLRPENLGDYPMFVSVFVVVYLGGYRHRSQFYKIVTRMWITQTALYILRIFTISMTNLPVTDNHCRYSREEISSFWLNTMNGLATMGLANVHCGDLLFSGHSIMIVIFWQITHTYFPQYRGLNWLVTFCTLMAFFFIVATRSHYTVDVIIGWFATMCTWKLVPNYWPYALRDS
ncbi:SMS-3 protein [Thecamonas trahens ATCC 50062]|uniref:SMS-3 protein n=1 Tax=Thecamonas trahens ATCC 50062 TaxID=461836 RepID=A0A0L0DE96_THETB|nr:SMS-3 protein [Thecamonas trahens ATCC 50062]KNC50609.1 SMS-3 protein [Thecamonas trahens ATCC 50062]|eukprot:XP_013762496.1 SMS-3 protein [Thecamonas trahens ATCC 50062]